MKLTKRHEGKAVKIQEAMIAGVYRRTWNQDLGANVGAGGCVLTFDTLTKPAVIASLSTDKMRCLIHWTELDRSMWIDADLIEKAS